MSRGEAMYGPSHRVRVAMLVGSIAFYVGLAVFARYRFDTDLVTAHLAYVPIVLAGMWWGRRALWVAASLGLFLLALSLVASGQAFFLRDGARIVLFLLVAFCVGSLRERLQTIRASVEQSEARYRTLIEKSLAGIFVYRDETMLFANSRFRELLGYDETALLGMSIWEVLHPEDHEKVRSLLKRRRAGEVTDLGYECRYRTAKGEMIWADVLSAETLFEGAPAILVNVYDVTSKKLAEARRAELAAITRSQEEQLVHSSRLAELGEMAAAIAHELNQPLTGIRTFAKNALYMIENDAGGIDEVADNLRHIAGQVDRASRIIGQMRELAAKSRQAFDRVDVNAVLRQTVDFLQSQLRLSGVETDLALAPLLPPILGDRVRLEQVFLNIVVNARQAMEASPARRLSVRTRLEEGQPRPVVVEIADTGKGFDDSEVAKIFTPFYTTKEVGKGTGLGLSISHRIVRDHGGVIEASGKRGEGACFVLRLPSAEACDAEGSGVQG